MAGPAFSLANHVFCICEWQGREYSKSQSVFSWGQCLHGPSTVYALDMNISFYYVLLLMCILLGGPLLLAWHLAMVAIFKLVHFLQHHSCLQTLEMCFFCPFDTLPLFLSFIPRMIIICPPPPWCSMWINRENVLGFYRLPPSEVDDK